ncbi:MAG TPA: DUF2087 domain-containing protein, partial [Anaerolineales bacterium]|nr:DUF2087 domain-containing protein [Anaerolineales bacterium]
ALTRGPQTLTALAGELGIHPSEANRHIEQLVVSGVLREVNGQYSINEKTLESIAREQFGNQRETYLPAPDLDETSRKVLAAHLNADGTIKQIPAQASKLRVILDYLVAAFTPGMDYTEKEVNTILRRFHLDTAALRRALIDEGLLQRESNGSRYWRSPQPAEERLV